MSRNDKSTSTPTTPIPPNVTKLCHIVKRPDFDGYGFNLHSEKVKPGQFIGKVDPKSPAEEAGLKEGDRIIEVNGVAIGSETHKQVVQRIKAISCEVRLLLIDVDGKGDAPKSPAIVKKLTPVATPTVPTTTMPKMETPPTTPTTPTTNGSSNAEYHGTKQELPGESANISSISMVSTKRMSGTSSASAASSNTSATMSADVVDKAINSPKQNNNNDAMLMMSPMPDLTNGIMEKKNDNDKDKDNDNDHNTTTAAMKNNINNNNKYNNNNNIVNSNGNSNNNMTMTMSTPITPPSTRPEMANSANVPPPPSAITATNNNNNNVSSSNNMTTAALNNANGSAGAAAGMKTMATATATTTTTTASPPANSPSAGGIRAGSLNLTMTAAEMRAKLMSKKKYDPKSESVDLKKKFEIIQKL